WLHGGVSRERKFVERFNFFRGAVEGGVRIAVIANDLAGLDYVVEKLLAQRSRRFGSGWAFIPGDLKGFAALDDRPGIIPQDGNAASGEGALAHGIDGKDVAHSGHSLGLCGVKGFHFSAENGTAGDDGVEHARHA